MNENGNRNHCYASHPLTHAEKTGRQREDFSRGCSGCTICSFRVRARSHTHTLSGVWALIGRHLSAPPRESLRGLLQCSAPGAWKRWSETFFSPHFYFWAGYRRSVTALIFQCFPTVQFPSVRCSQAPFADTTARPPTHRSHVKHLRGNKNLSKKTGRKQAESALLRGLGAATSA